MARRGNVQVVGDKALIANIAAKVRGVQRRVGVVNEFWGGRVLTEAQANSPYDTGRTFRAHRLLMSPGNLVFTVYVDPAPFEAEGLPYYPLWLHEGTSRMGARPWMAETYNRLSPFYRAGIAAEMRRALRERV